MADSFVHLHVHTEYSMLDGAARVKDLFAEAERMGMPALACTDHGNLYGAFDFYNTAKSFGVKPIVGIEAYLAPGHRTDKTTVALGGGGKGEPDAKGDKYTHMTILATSDEGYRNLVSLASLASLEGYYYKPRMDREILARYSGGLVATSGCPSGEVNRLLQQGRYDAAKQAASDYNDIFGRGNFFVELMDHGVEIEKRTMTDLLRIAKELDLPLLATNDLHYTREEDAVAQEVLLCVQTGSTLADPNRFRFDGSGYYLKSPEEMRHVWRDFPEACDNTLAIAERCDLHLGTDGYKLPRFEVPEGETEESWFRVEVERGMRRRFGDAPPEEVRRQVEYEAGVIMQMGFPSYFLIVADLVRHARETGIRVGPGRGSAAGCMVSYCLGITDLDPMAHGLVFERFLNPERVSMPDIDLDFDERRRADMIRYATEKYGEERVAQIITYSTIKAKAAIRDSSRVLGLPYAVGDKISKLMPPPIMGRDMPLRDVFDAKSDRYKEAAELRSVYETDPEVKKVLDTARGLEGLKRQAGVHAAGVVISRDPLTEHIPVWRREADGAVITQFDMGAVEKLGLLKMDFLGLRNLTVLDDCLAHIRDNRGETVVLEDLPLDDVEAYRLLARGDTIGVFQLEGGPMRALLRSMQPTTFEHISAVLALYRPGPMAANAHNDYADRKNGRKQIVPIHPELAECLEEILGESYGLIVYQEQVMAIAQKLAGYTLGQADLLRRAMGKKKKEIIDKEYVPFSEGMRKNGYSDAAIKTLWEILVPFSDYAFNKAHTAGYGLVSYWTAFLKAHYPSEYLAALLTSVKDNRDQSALYLHECRRMGIKVLPPDVNESDLNFTPRGTDIRFGLSAIRNVGENVVNSIVATRRAKGRYTGFHDFLRKVEGLVCNKRVVESLIKAGAFDSLGHTRRGLMAVHADAIDACMETKRAEAAGQFSLFGEVEAAAADEGGDPLGAIAIPPQEWDKKLLLNFEREMLSLYVSDHPLLGVEHVLAQHTDTRVTDLTGDGAEDGKVVTVGGLLSSVARKTTKRGDAYAQAVLEDLEGAIDVWFFPNTYREYGLLLAEDEVVVVKAKVDKREDTPKLVAIEVSRPDLSAAGPRGPVVLRLDMARCTEPVVEELKGILRQHPGMTEVHLELQRGGKTTYTLKLDDGLRVTANPSLMGDLKQLLGAGCLG
ncbi:MAG TPA: DNA polymerase III subunit alpha [Mycobacteriales bacterium]|nr:DNA polymerase III subunit alpha [Mycobacteriales bacterium]